MFCRTQYHNKVHGAEYLLNLFQPEGDCFLQTPFEKCNGKYSGRVARTSTKSTLVAKAATKEGTGSEQEQVDKESGNNNVTEDRNY